MSQSRRKTVKRSRSHAQKGGELNAFAPKGTEISHPGTSGMILIKLNDKKLIFGVKDDTALLVKVVYSSSEIPMSKIYREIELQSRAAAHPPLRKRVPSIRNVFLEDSYVYITMDRIPGNAISDEFGETPEKITEFIKQYGMKSEDIWNQIRGIVNELRKIGILYFDITGYNFIFEAPYVSVIDFGNAEDIQLDTLNTSIKKLNTFLQGENNWISI